MAAEEQIKAKIALEGEKEYRAACKNINAGLREIGSEMKLCSAEFANNASSVEALTKKQQILQSQLSALGDKAAAAEAALTKMREGGVSPTDPAFLKMQTNLNNTRAEMATTQSQIEAIDGELQNSQSAWSAAAEAAEEASRKAENTGKGWQKLGSIVGATAKAVATATAAMVAAAAAIAVKLGKEAVEAYAEFEQLDGGVKTLFKDSANVVSKYAQGAYKSAGLSANHYMETVTSFSASLIQSLGGDTAQASELANVAITDMSDNVNKMGSNIGMLQNAYAGFARGSFAMLDNLKLGYSGSQAEMVRLINDSGILEKKISKISEVSFDQMIAAIHAVQEQLGIAGATAEEAATTISGSANAMKAAWSNLLVGMADDQQDFNVLVENLIDSALTFGDNILPRIRVVLKGISKLISTALPRILDEIPRIIDDVLPDLVKASANIVKSIVQGFKKNSDTLIKTAFDAVRSAASALLGSAAEPINAILRAVEGAVKGLVSFLANNGGLVIGIISGIGAAFAAWKISGIVTAAIAAIKAFTLANEGATIAQAALNLVMEANPAILLATAIGLLTAGIVAYCIATADAESTASALSDRQLDMIASAESAATAYADLSAAVDKKAASDLAEIDYTQRLYGELLKIVDANGKVRAGYEGRASFILGELNSALGTEYSMTGNVVAQYENLKSSIQGVIETKRAQILLDANEEKYRQAVENVADAERARAAAAIELAAAQERYAEAQNKVNKAMESGWGVGRSLNEEYAAAYTALEEVTAQYDALDGAVKTYHADIDAYSTASAQLLEGNTSAALATLQALSGGFETAASVAGKAAEEQKRILKEQVIEATVSAGLLREAYKNGIAGVTEEMVTAAQEQANVCAEEYSKVGGQIVLGITNGVTGSNYVLDTEMQNTVTAAINAAMGAAEGSTDVGSKLGENVQVGIQGRASSVISTMGKTIDDAAATGRTKAAAGTDIGSIFGGNIQSSLQAKAPLIKSTSDNVVTQAISSAKSTAAGSTEIGAELGFGIHSALNAKSPTIRATAISAVSQAINSAKAEAGKAESVGAEIGNGMTRGIKGAIKALSASAVSAVKSALAAAKSAADINSPSRVWRDEVGAMMAKGIGVGFTDQMRDVSKDIRRATSGLVPSIDSNLSVGAGQPIQQTIIIQQPVATPDETARAIRRQMRYGLAGARV